jgi:hypothetical protein
VVEDNTYRFDGFGSVTITPYFIFDALANCSKLRPSTDAFKGLYKHAGNQNEAFKGHFYKHAGIQIYTTQFYRIRKYSIIDHYYLNTNVNTVFIILKC